MSKLSVILTAVVAAILVVGAFVGGWFAGKGKRVTIVERDTTTTVVTIRDTITEYQPKYITKTEVRKELVYLKDTIRVHDSTYVVMPVEKRVYEDTNYRAVVSGIQPSLDEISVYPKTQIITQPITQTVEGKRKPTRFGVGLQAGFGGMYCIGGKQFDYGPYIGVGVSYNLIRW